MDVLPQEGLPCIQIPHAVACQEQSLATIAAEPHWYARLPMTNEWVSVEDPIWDNCTVKREVTRFRNA